ncbi:MAG: hypothetical protein LBS59_01765 [Puniceicoccales bacterium]|jgi:hypothetical protein|nr:hypothetical protein [Puniceicoccales bacterium]
MTKKSAKSEGNHSDTPELMTFATPDFSDAGQGFVVALTPLGKARARMATFSVDVHCLGIRKISLTELPLKVILDKGLSALRVVPVEPSTARGIVEGAAAFAKKLGFLSPQNLPEGIAFFGQIRATKPPFSFGKNGKPFYTQQEGDSDEFVESVLARLEKTCGSDGFGFLLDDLREELLDGKEDALADATAADQVFDTDE